MDLSGRQRLRDTIRFGLFHAFEEIVPVDPTIVQHHQKTRVSAGCERPALHLRRGQHVDRIKSKLRHLFAVILVHLGKDRAEIDMPEGNMTAFIPHDVEGQLLQQRAGCRPVHIVESAESETFHNHIHADHHFLMPVRLERRVNQRFQPWRHRIGHRDFVAIFGIDLNVACFIHRLRGGIKLRTRIRYGMGHTGRGHQRPLLPVQEL